MVRTGFSSIGLAVISLLMLGGCSGMQKGTAGMQDMKPPERPGELDRLEAFVGNWEGTMEMEMAGAPEVMKATGTNQIQWACDKRFLMENFEADVGKDQKMIAIGLWTWDAKRKKYRIWWFDNSGSVGEGWATYDAAEKTWHHEASGDNPMLGKRTYGEGTSRFTDDNTMEWTWKEWDNALKWGKPVMEMSGSNVRK